MEYECTLSWSDFDVDHVLRWWLRGQFWSCSSSLVSFPLSSTATPQTRTSLNRRRTDSRATARARFLEIKYIDTASMKSILNILIVSHPNAILSSSPTPRTRTSLNRLGMDSRAMKYEYPLSWSDFDIKWVLRRRLQGQSWYIGLSDHFKVSTSQFVYLNSLISHNSQG